MALAVEAAQSRHLPGFLEQFALRSTRMLDAIWGGVAVYRGRETELHAISGGPTTEATTDWLISRARASQNDVEALAIPKEIAATLPFAEEPGVVVFVRIAASDNERLGTLFLIRNRKSLSADQKRLLHALASHAALSLENFRRFSQLERSKRQWVEDIDAISDYIVVHDQDNSVLRVKHRSNKPFTRVPPWRVAGGPGRRSYEQLEANRANGKRSALPLLPRYAATKGRVCGRVGRAYLSRFDFANAGPL